MIIDLFMYLFSLSVLHVTEKKNKNKNKRPSSIELPVGDFTCTVMLNTFKANRYNCLTDFEKYECTGNVKNDKSRNDLLCFKVF